MRARSLVCVTSMVISCVLLPHPVQAQQPDYHTSTGVALIGSPGANAESGPDLLRRPISPPENPRFSNSPGLTLGERVGWTVHPRWILPATGAVIGVAYGVYEVANTDAETTPGSMLVPPMAYGAIGALTGLAIDWIIREVRK
jgi:hypothetical protein